MVIEHLMLNGLNGSQSYKPLDRVVIQCQMWEQVITKEARMNLANICGRCTSRSRLRQVLPELEKVSSERSNLELRSMLTTVMTRTKVARENSVCSTADPDFPCVALHVADRIHVSPKTYEATGHWATLQCSTRTSIPPPSKPHSAPPAVSMPPWSAASKSSIVSDLDDLLVRKCDVRIEQSYGQPSLIKMFDG